MARRFHTYRSLLLYAVFALCSIGIPIGVSPLSALAQGQLAFPSSGGMQRVPGNLIPLLSHAKPIAPTPQDLVLHLSVCLHLRNQDALNALLAAQQDPTSPQYHHYLTPQEFGAQFSPTQQTVDAVVAYLRQQHLQVTSIASNHVLIDATATVAITEHAFVLTLNNYQLQHRVVYAPNVDPAVPAHLLPFINNITGLSDVATYHPIRLHRFHQFGAQLAGPAGGFTPDELRTAYDVQPLLHAGADGSGQTIGLFELDGYTPSDINTYLSQYHLGPPKYTPVLVDGATMTPGADALEVELDMQIASALAPGAKQRVYIGPNTPAGVDDLYNTIVTENVAKVISISWGICELASTPARLDGLDVIFKQGAAQGQTFVAASGDAGAYDCGDTNLAVDSPASDPYVVGVGGTTLRTESTGVYGSETAWGGASGGLTLAGGGGGHSSHFLLPTYQHGLSPAGLYRMVPDVAANADPLTGYALYSSLPFNPSLMVAPSPGAPPTRTAEAATSGQEAPTGWITVGGTSAAAPLWAGILADIAQFLSVSPQQNLGYALPALYQLYSTPQLYPPYHDVTSGSNRYYQAGLGYDLATGVGTPDAWNMARDLQSATGLPTQLLSNPGFEDGMVAWEETSSGHYELITQTNPHSGKYSAYLCGYPHCDDAIAQSLLVPASMQRATLSYWTYIGRGDPTPGCQDHLQVLLRTAKGASIATVQTLCNTDANGWVSYSFDVTQALTPYRGQIVQLVFEAQGIGTPKANFLALVDDASLNTLSSAPGITVQLLQNPSFDQGPTSWQETSRGGYEIISTTIVHPNAGSIQSAYLCGYPHCDDTIVQQVLLPTKLQRVTLSYWVYLTRGDSSTTCRDSFRVFLQTAKGAPIAIVQKLCNTDASGWTQYSFDLTGALAPYSGQAVQVGFTAVGESPPRANFFAAVDDVALLVTHQ